MELIRVTGTRTELIDLRDVPGVQVVAASAVDRGDGTWVVSAYGPDGTLDEVRTRGFDVQPVKSADQGRTERALAAGTGYPDSAAINTRLRDLAAAHPDVCHVQVLPQLTHENREVLSLQITAGDGAGPAVVVIGGVHAREWAPPDALLSLAEGLVHAYAAGGPFEHPAWVDQTAQPPLPYAAWSVPAADVKRLLEGVTLILVPLVNPDGRDFSLAGADDVHYMWRKNRRPRTGAAGPWCHGVDLNRNFDIAWDFDRYYTPAAARAVQSSKKPCDPQVYIGPTAASEPETQNVQGLVTDHRPAYFMDVHSYARDILYPWGMDDDQNTDPAKNFGNPDWDRTGVHGGRDGLGGVYGEYLPADVRAQHVAVAERMRDAMVEQAGPQPKARHRSTYTIKQALGLYPTTGTSDDYCAGLTMLDPTKPPIHAYCLECGIDQAPDDPTDDEGGFHPDRNTKYPKIEREVHAAVLTLTRAALPTGKHTAEPR